MALRKSFGPERQEESLLMRFKGAAHSGNELIHIMFLRSDRDREAHPPLPQSRRFNRLANAFRPAMTTIWPQAWAIGGYWGA